MDEQISRLYEMSEEEQAQFLRSQSEGVMTDLGKKLEDLASSHSGVVAKISVTGDDSKKGLLVLLCYAYHSLPGSPDPNIRQSRVETLQTVVEEMGLTRKDLVVLRPVSNDIKEIVEEYFG